MIETNEQYRKRRYKELIGEKTWEAYSKEGAQSLEARGAKGVSSGEALKIIEKELEERHHEPVSEKDEERQLSYPSRYKPKKSTFVGELGNLAGETWKEVSEYPTRKVRETVQDIRVGRVVREKHREGRIRNRLVSAEKRGAESEEQEYKDKRELKKERQKIALAEEKAARIEGAKILARQKYRSTKPSRSQAIRTQMIGLGHNGNIYGFYTLPKISYGEYAGWITGGTRVSRSGQQSARKSSDQPIQQKSSIFELYNGDATQAYALLGFRVGGEKKVPKTGKKERRYNIFSGTWED